MKKSNYELVHDALSWKQVNLKCVNKKFFKLRLIECKKKNVRHGSLFLCVVFGFLNYISDGKMQKLSISYLVSIRRTEMAKNNSCLSS